VLLFVLPFFVGGVFKDEKRFVERYVKGAMFELAIWGMCYYVVLLVMRTNSLKVLSVLYEIVVCPFVVVGIWKTICKRGYFKYWLNRFSVYYKSNRVIFLCLTVLVFYQLVRIGIGMPFQARDLIAYDPLVTRMVESGLIYAPPASDFFIPEQLVSISSKYITTPWYVYEAFWAQLLNVHSLIVSKTLIPIYILLLTYLSLWLLSGEFFRENLEKKLLFVLFCGLMFEGRLIFGEQSAYVLVWPSWGKSVASTIGCTLLLTWFIRNMKVESLNCQDILWLAIFSLSGAFTTAAAIMVFPIELGTLSFVYWLQKKESRVLIVGLIGILPCVFQLVLLFVYEKGLLTNWLLGSGT